MKNRLWGVLLAALALLLLTGLSASAETRASGACGAEVQWTLDEEGVLTVSGRGAMTDYAADGSNNSPFASYESEIKTVVIETGVTSVGDNAFYECYRTSRVTLPEGLLRIGDGAFYYCRELTELTVPAGVTEICRRAFRSCLALETVTLPDGVERIGEKAFADTAWYNAQPDGPVYLGGALLTYKGEMPRKTEVVVKNGTRLIADGAFWACGRMVSVTLPDGLRHIGEAAFWKCDGFSELTLPEGLLTIGEEAFYCCNCPEHLELPRSLTAVGKGAFSGCRGLKSVFVPAGVKTIGPQAFPPKTEIVGYEGAYAQSYAEQMGLPFTARADAFAPETTTAPEGERAKLQRRKDIGTAAACAAAGVIGLAAIVGLLALRRSPAVGDAPDERPTDEAPEDAMTQTEAPTDEAPEDAPPPDEGPTEDAPPEN